MDNREFDLIEELKANIHGRSRKIDRFLEFLDQIDWHYKAVYIGGNCFFVISKGKHKIVIDCGLICLGDYFINKLLFESLKKIADIERYNDISDIFDYVFWGKTISTGKGKKTDVRETE